MKWVGLDNTPVPITVGGKTSVMSIPVEISLRDVNLSNEIDAILILGFWTNYQQHVEATLTSNKALVAAIKRLPANKVIWSYCTGVCIVATAGKLNGKTAAATWWLTDFVLNTYPTVQWKLHQTCV